jgi:virginiamycin B lyase
MRPPRTAIASAIMAALSCAALGLPATASATVTHYPASGLPYGIASGPDGALWFAEESAGKIGRLTTAGVLTDYDITTPSSQPYQIAAGPDAAMWFTESATAKIGRITTAGVVTDEFGALAGHPTAITTGPDSALWYVADNAVGRMTSSGTATTYTAAGFGGSNGIATGPDSALWFTGHNTKIGRVDTTGTVTTFNLPTAATLPWGIAAGPDGALWFTEKLGNAIGRITTAGVVTNEYPIPEVNGIYAGPRGITRGPDGAMWFTAWDGGRIGRIAMDGTITQFVTGGNGPHSIVSGSDGAMWFSETAGSIGRITIDPDAPGGPPPSESPPPDTSPTPSSGLRPTSTSVGGCAYNTATFYFFCTITVADTGAAPASTPGGFVNLAHFPNGGCALGGPGGGGSASCLAVIVPPATETSRVVTATYAGDSTHATSSGSASLALIGNKLPTKPNLIGRVTLQPPSMFPAPSGASTSAAKPGSVVTYTLKAPARVRFTVKRPKPGRMTTVRKGKTKAKSPRCAAPSKRNRHGKPCTRFVALPGSFTLLGKRGKNHFRFRGRIGGRSLKPGRYQLAATPKIFAVTGKIATQPFRVKHR